MLFRIGASIKMKVQYLARRGSVYQFCMRVPAPLIQQYGCKFIRKSLETSCLQEATKKVESLARKYTAEFSISHSGKEMTPESVAAAGISLAGNYEMDLDLYISQKVEPKLVKYAQGDDRRYREAMPGDFLSPVEVVALSTLQKGKKLLLSDVLELYLRTHAKSGDEKFTLSSRYHWSKLIDHVGNLEFEKLGRENAHSLIASLSEKRLSTGTVRRILNACGAITQQAISELQILRSNPFKDINIPGEGKDSREIKTPSSSEIDEIVRACMDNRSSVTSLIILLQVELGARIGEVSGLGIDDVYLDHAIPHVHFRERPWRTLKTDESERKVPVVGVALAALKLAVGLPRGNDGLFANYARVRGNDAASAAVNKKLERWGVKSHGFRHAMKDRLRAVDCPVDVRDAIQGHANGSVAEKYGEGHTLTTMQRWLKKIAVEVS